MEVDRVAQDGAAGRDCDGRMPAEGQRPIRPRHDRRARVTESDMRRADDQGVGTERGQLHPHLIAADTGVHNLTQGLIVETGVCNPETDVRRVHSRAPSADPVLVAIG